MNKIKNTGMIMIALIVLLAVLSLISIAIGRYTISMESLYSIILKPSLINKDSELASAATILFEVRIARVIAAVMIGAALSTAGASYQGIFRNPMVSPDILGAATGAGFGAALAILFGANALIVQISAFGFGLLAVAVAYIASAMLTGKSGGATLTLVLTGMVVSSLFSAFISIIKYVGDPYDTLPAITFWLMGGLTYVTKSDVLVILAPFLAGIVPLMLIRWRINVLSLNDEEAGALGIDTKKMRMLIIICATLISSTSVAIGGMIGWVGLIVPHISRMIVGPSYSKLLPCSALMGGLFLLIVDDFARILFPQEIPLGVLTAMIGAPFFLYLMYKGKRSFI